MVPLWEVNVPQRGVVKSARCAARPNVDRGLPLDACEFAGALVDATCDARLCVDGTFCPKRCFGDPVVYGSCPARLEKKQKSRKDRS
jgi:hypothetical protein